MSGIEKYKKDPQQNYVGQKWGLHGHRCFIEVYPGNVKTELDLINGCMMF
jgi:hypothetical protein